MIDYPRGVGIDDESFCAIQAIGLIDDVLPHTSPNQIMRFVNGDGRLLAEIAPSQTPFGWPRRSGFIQPLVDAELLKGLDRFDCVEVLWSSTLEAYEPRESGVSATVVAARRLTGDRRCALPRRVRRRPQHGTASDWHIVRRDDFLDPLDGR